MSFKVYDVKKEGVPVHFELDNEEHDGYILCTLIKDKKEE